MLFSTLLIPLLAAPGTLAQDGNGDESCASACSKWSKTLDTCYGIFTASPHIHGLEYSNQFLACLCRGTLSYMEYGNETMAKAAGICETCEHTPAIIKNDLTTFLSLCQVQATNGTARNASNFAPLGYSTVDDGGGDSANPVSKSMAAAAPNTAANYVLASAALIVTSVLSLW